MWQQSFVTRGFAVIADVFASEELGVVQRDLLSARFRRSRAGARHILHHPSIANLANDPRLLDIARPILGTDPRPFRATLFDKSPSANWLVVWHQDTALPLLERAELAGWGPWSVKEGVIYAHAPTEALEGILALRIHLDDSTDKNGPLRVLPGTHTRGVLNDTEIKRLASQIAPVDCLVKAGGVLAMQPLIVHASSKSLISTARRVLHIEYTGRMLIAENLQLACA